MIYDILNKNIYIFIKVFALLQLDFIMTDNYGQMTNSQVD